MLSRRAFVRSAGGLALALPLMDSLRARAQEGAFPKRLVLMYTPNGVIHSGWFPLNVVSETTFDLNQAHAPLERYKDRLLLLGGVDLKVAGAPNNPGGPHQRGIGTLFTARDLQSGTFAATPIGTDTGYQDLWGIGFWKGQVFGFSDDGTFVLIDTTTGAATTVEVSDVEWWGAAVTTAAPIVD